MLGMVARGAGYLGLKNQISYVASYLFTTYYYVATYVAHLFGFVRTLIIIIYVR